MPAAVSITQNLESIELAIEQALAHLDVERLFRGRLVAVKPNDTWASPADTTGVTQGDTLRGVLRVLRRYEPSHIVVSGGAGAAETDEVFRHSGMMAVVEEEGVEFFDHNRPPFEDVELDYGASPEVKGPQRTVKVNPRVLEYDVLVALNQLKVHYTATVTLAMKNIAMSYPAADHYGHPRGSHRRHHHFFDDMHSFIVAMCRRFPIDLAVTVGHPAMIGHGPLGGVPVETGLCLASTDAVAADAVGAALLGFGPQGVRHIWEAQQLGMGETDTDRMRFPALSLKDAIGAFTMAAYGRRLTFEHA
jgi:uncharacterized protein (DUF362 family)